jgi:hypothetical protein
MSRPKINLALAAPTVIAQSVPELNVRDEWLDGARSNASTVARSPKSLVDPAVIRRSLPPAPRLPADALFEVILDESASVRGGNDVVGLRHELLHIALTHLVTRKSPGTWHVQISTFDINSPLDLPRTRLDGIGLEIARRALCSPSAGSCSILGPSLQRAEMRLAQFVGPTLLVVLSDFELFDPDPDHSLANLAKASATETMAVSLNANPPAALIGSQVRTVRVCSGDQPSSLARAVIAAAQSCAFRALGGQQ